MNTATKSHIDKSLEQLAPDALNAARQISGKILVNGSLTHARTDQMIEVIHPGNLQVIGEVPPLARRM